MASVPAPINFAMPSLSSFAPSPAAASTPPSAPNLSASPPPPSLGSAINLRLGSYEVGTGGVYRTTSTNGSGASLQIDSNKVKEGLTNGLAGARDLGTGAMSLFGRVRQNVTEASRRTSFNGAAGQQQG